MVEFVDQVADLDIVLNLATYSAVSMSYHDAVFFDGDGDENTAH